MKENRPQGGLLQAKSNVRFWPEGDGRPASAIISANDR